MTTIKLTPPTAICTSVTITIDTLKTGNFKIHNEQNNKTTAEQSVDEKRENFYYCLAAGMIWSWVKWAHNGDVNGWMTGSFLARIKQMDVY